MAVGFPPIPVFPNAFDTDQTLFVVHNTSEAALATDNPPWSQDVDIVPVTSDALEIWADNGFANISGELFYYDAVQKNGNGKVFRLKRCARNLGGKTTKFNKAGTMVRGFVIAEHHNQLATTAINIERLIGSLCDGSAPNSLDCILSLLESQSACIDDFNCPDVTFDFEIDENATNNCDGTVAIFNVTIDGSFTNFRIDFGDGNSSTQQTGTHTYAPGSKIDPVVIVSNDKCEIVQTPSDRSLESEPQTNVQDEPFDIPLPVIPDFPILDLPDIITPSTTLTLPEIVFPCLDIATLSIPPVNISIPDTNVNVSIPDINLSIPSVISIIFEDPPSFPPIEFGEIPSFPPIEFGEFPSIPSIQFAEVSVVFSAISFENFPTIPPIEFGEIPSFPPIEVNVSIPSEISVIDDIPISIDVLDDIPISIDIIHDIPLEITIIDDIPLEITILDDIPLQITVLDDIPLEIFLTDDIPDNIFVIDDVPDVITVIDDIPTDIHFTLDINWNPVPMVSIEWGQVPTISGEVTIKCSGEESSGGASMMGIQSMGGHTEYGRNFRDTMTRPLVATSASLGIPSEIKIIAPKMPNVIELKHDIPSKIGIESIKIPDIRIIGPLSPIPPVITLMGMEIPDVIKVVSENIPTKIEIDASGMPDVIRLEVPDDFPSVIKLDASEIPKHIQVIGIPESIEIKGNIPSEITIKAPDNLEIPLVYKGSPIPIKFDMTGLNDEESGENPCFALVPCKPK
jgi:PKD repeat protein